MANYNGFTKINNSILLDANISANADDKLPNLREFV